MRLAPPIGTALRLGLPVGGGTDAHRVMSYNPPRPTPSSRIGTPEGRKGGGAIPTTGRTASSGGLPSLAFRCAGKLPCHGS